MKKQAVIISIIALLAFMFSISFTGCDKTTIEGDGIPVLPLKPDIVHPPDSFKLVFPISTSGFIGTIITFDSTTTWFIEKLNAQSAMLRVNKINDTLPSVLIEESIMMEFNEKEPYEFLARNNNHPSPRSLVVVFRKSDTTKTHRY